MKYNRKAVEVAKFIFSLRDIENFDIPFVQNKRTLNKD